MRYPQNFLYIVNLDKFEYDLEMYFIVLSGSDWSFGGPGMWWSDNFSLRGSSGGWDTDLSVWDWGVQHAWGHIEAVRR